MCPSSELKKLRPWRLHVRAKVTGASQPCVIGGYHVPVDARVIVDAWAIQRDPNSWDNPGEFRPERFVEVGSGNWLHNGSDFSHLPFASGRRICTGIRVAEVTIKYLLASLLHSYEWKLPSVFELDLSDKYGLVKVSVYLMKGHSIA